MTDLNELQIFVQVAQTHSFTLAAKKLGVPKSAASRGLARLEQRLGVRLLQRTTRRVTLTDDGEVYLQHCQRVLRKKPNRPDLKAVSASCRPRPGNWLRVAGAPLTFARYFLGELLEPFSRSLYFRIACAHSVSWNGYYRRPTITSTAVDTGWPSGRLQIARQAFGVWQARYLRRLHLCRETGECPIHRHGLAPAFDV